MTRDLEKIPADAQNRGLGTGKRTRLGDMRHPASEGVSHTLEHLQVRGWRRVIASNPVRGIGKEHPALTRCASGKRDHHGQRSFPRNRYKYI